MKTTKSIIAVSVILLLGAVVGAGVIDWYAQINPTIDVTGVIYVDGQEFPQITDVVNTTVGNTTIIEHTIKNKHTELTYNLSFNYSNNATTGLTVSIWYGGNEVSFVEVFPDTLITFEIQYEVLPNADPREAYNCSAIVIAFEDAY